MKKFPLHFALLFETAADIVEHVGWTQGELAKDKYGCKVEYSSPKAACFCGEGALRKANSLAGRKYDFSKVFDALLQFRLFPSSNQGIHPWNDRRTRTKEDVADVFRDAATLVRAQHA